MLMMRIRADGGAGRTTRAAAVVTTDAAGTRRSVGRGQR